MSEEYLGYDEEPQPGYMQPHKYRVRLRCRRCEHEYTRVVKSLMSPNPPCPRKACKEAALEEEVQKRLANAQAIIESRQMPGLTGSTAVKNVDKTADIVMADYGLTNLRDDMRPGESMAPKLAPNLQKQADNFFKGGGGQSKRMNAIAKKAMAGAYRSTAVAPTDVFPGTKGASPLRRVER